MQQYRDIFHKLFPQSHPDDLTHLPREALLELITSSTPKGETSTNELPKIETISPPRDLDAESLEQFQPMPEDPQDGSDYDCKDVPSVSDDVNALSLEMNRSTSYLGISSVMAILRVIIRLQPESQNYFETRSRSTIVSEEQSIPPRSGVTCIQDATTPKRNAPSSAWDEIPLINAYFTYVQAFIPIIDEQLFRDTYLAGHRSDSRWLLLLNTVLAMGSIAAGSAEDTSHKTYFARAKLHLTIDTLGHAHLEVVQALAILGGLYLHYLQQPILANALMGATLRMATTLGLHREYPAIAQSSRHRSGATSEDMRRRVWWCMFNLDAWAGSTLGRPSMGRHSFASTIPLPQQPTASKPAFSVRIRAHGQTPGVEVLALLQENIRFCTITTRIEDALAVSPLILAADLALLDTALVDWYESSSCQIGSKRLDNTDDHGTTVLRNVMRWRYLSARIILHRPVLLWYAIRRNYFTTLPKEKAQAVTICRDCTAQLITDIASTWAAPKRCQISGWNATWLLYQAVMVSLLSLFSDREDETVVGQSSRQVEMALATLAELRAWSPTAERSREVVNRIYEASKGARTDVGLAPDDAAGQGNQKQQSHTNGTSWNLPTATTSNPPTHEGLSSNAAFAPFPGNSAAGFKFGSSTELETGVCQSTLRQSTSNNDILMDNMFDSLTWSTGWNHLDNPFGSIGGDHAEWSGSMSFDGYLDPILPETGHGVSGAGDGFGKLYSSG